MNGSLSFLRGVTKQAELDDGIHIRLQIWGRGSARIYFVSQDGVQNDVPEGFHVRDITYQNEIIELETAPDTRYFVLFWLYSYECVYLGITWKFITQQQWLSKTDLIGLMSETLSIDSLDF